MTVFREESGAVGLSGRDLPAAQALAGHASVVARARLYEASGAFPGQGTSSLEALAYLHLLNGVSARDAIAFARAAAAEPPDGGADDGGPEDGGPEDGGPEDSGPEDSGPEDSGPEDSGPEDSGPEDSGPEDGGPDDGGPEDGGPEDGEPEDGEPRDGGPDDDCNEGSRSTAGSRAGDPGGSGGHGGGEDPGDGEDPRGGEDPGGGSGLGNGGDDGPGNGDHPGPRPGGDHRALPEVTVPLVTLQGRAARAGESPLLGPLDPALARDLAAAAARSPSSRWGVTIVDDKGYAVGHGIARPRRGRRQRPPPPSPPSCALPARVNITVTGTRLRQLAAQPAQPRPGAPPGDWELIPRAAGTWALTLPGGRELAVRFDVVPTHECDHRHEVSGYEPGERLRRLVQVRDQECTFPPCSRPAKDSDFEHAVPYDQGGRTDACNAGARSRACHQVKQSKGWTVIISSLN